MNTKKPNTKKEYPFSGGDLVAALEEGLETIRAGRVGTLRTTTLELPEPVKSFNFSVSQFPENKS
jgi:hypothetical protein